MRSADQSSPCRNAILSFTIGLILWAATVVLVVSIAHDKAQRGELINLTREIGR